MKAATMHPAIRVSLTTLEFSLILAGTLVAQQTEAETQRATLAGLRRFAVSANVQLAQGAKLQRIEESLLRTRLEQAMQRVGMAIDGGSDVRDGSAAQISLLYLVVETRNQSGQVTGFAASSCLHAAQIVSVPRLTNDRHIAYAVIPTWRNCGLLVGDPASYPSAILRNVDEQIARFLDAWRSVNVPRPLPASPGNPELGISSVPRFHSPHQVNGVRYQVAQHM